MKIASTAALLAAILVPAAVCAQEVQPAPTAPVQRQTHQATYQYHRWTKRLANINLSAQQQQQVQHYLDQFAASHPAGSPRDKAGAKALERQILGVLTPTQQAQYQQEMQTIWAQHHQEHLEQQQPGQAPQQPAPPPKR